MEIVGSEVYEAENPKVIKEARDFSHVRFTLSDRIYSCDCGNIIDRDVNAAKNLSQYEIKTK